MEEIQNNPINTSIQQTQKKSKTPIVVIVVALLSVAIGVVLGEVYHRYNKQDSSTKCNCTNCNCKKEEQPNTECNCKKNTTKERTNNTEETDITDKELLNDLDEKLSVIFLTSDTDRSIKLGASISGYLTSLFEQGGINEANKTYSIFSALDFGTPTEDEKGSILTQYYGVNNVSQIPETDQGALIINRIDGKEVSEKYKEIYGQELVRNQNFNLGTNPSYHYNTEYDIYYSILGMAGFGGPMGTTYVYKDRYTTDNDHAYVYIYAGFIGVDNHLYSDWGIDSDLGTLTDDEVANYTINEENYKQFTEYKFIFDKSADDNYYFSKTERVSE